MVSDIKEEAKKAIVGRLGNPVLGYIACSWLACNWSNIAFLFMSNEKVEKRISAILNQEGLWLDYFVYPILTGIGIFIIFPYIQWGLSRLHLFAAKMKRIDKNREINDKLSDDEAFAEKKAFAETASELAKAKRLKEIAHIEEEKKQLPFKTETMKKEHEALETKLKESQKLHTFYTEEVKKLQKQKHSTLVKSVIFQMLIKAKDTNLQEHLDDAIKTVFSDDEWTNVDVASADSFHNAETHEVIRALGMSLDEFNKIINSENAW